jgi:MFS family permease
VSDGAGLRPDDHPDVGERSPALGEDGGPFSHGRATVTVAILCLVTIVAFEAMALSAIMPRIAEDLHAVRVYGLAFSVLLTAQLAAIVLAGVWTERHGPTPGMLAGQLLLAGGSALCAVAPHFGFFVLGRALAGFGGGLLLVMLYVVVGRIYPESVRPRVFTAVSAAWIVPALLGAPLAAWITGNLGWRWVFWLLLPPIAATALLISARAKDFRQHLQALPSPRDHTEHVRAAWAGIGIAVAAGALQWGTTGLHRELNPHLVGTVLGLVGIVAIAPRLVPAGTWTMARGLPAVLCGRALITAAFFGSLTYAPLMLVHERHLRLGIASILVSVGSVGWAAGAYVQGLERFHRGRWRLVAVGGGVLAVALALMAGIAALDWPTVFFALPFLLGGLGMGLAVASQAVLVLEHSPKADHGLASSALMLADVLGSVVGIAVAGAVFAYGHSRYDSDAPVLAGIWFGLAVVAGVVVLAGRRIGTSPEPDGP